VSRRADSFAGYLAMLGEMVRVRLAPPKLLSRRVGAESAEATDWKVLRGPAILGFIAVLAIAAGSSLPSSPFKLEMAGTWFFGEPPANAIAPSTSFLVIGLVAVYGGMALLIRVWCQLIALLGRRPGVPVKYLFWIGAAWIVPLLVIAPLFSRDVYSYAAQGEMMSRHLSPYVYGPGTLGSGPYVNPVDPLWLNTPAAYGPLFLMVDGFFATITLHNALWTVVMLRRLSVAGVALIAYCIPKITRAYGREVGPVFALAVLNPLVLLSLIGGAHNDAIMLGLLLAGMTAAKLRHPVFGVMLCALAAGIKAPAAIGIFYVAWNWTGESLPLRQRMRPLVSAGIISLAIMTFLSLVSGLGWGWIGNLATPGTVRSWMAPATGIGLALGGIAHTFGIMVSTSGVLSFTRVVGLLAAAVSALWLLMNSDRVGTLKALGLSLLLFVWLSPIVQPWYLTWGIILLAPIATNRLRRVAIVTSVLGPFVGLTGGHILLSELLSSLRDNPLPLLGGLAVAVFVLVAPIGRRAMRHVEGEGHAESYDMGDLQGALEGGVA
jgi:alpha-1,6-mannosyltransferase